MAMLISSAPLILVLQFDLLTFGWESCSRSFIISGRCSTRVWPPSKCTVPENLFRKRILDDAGRRVVSMIILTNNAKNLCTNSYSFDILKDGPSIPIPFYRIAFAPTFSRWQVGHRCIGGGMHDTPAWTVYNLFGLPCPECTVRTTQGNLRMPYASLPYGTCDVLEE